MQVTVHLRLMECNQLPSAILIPGLILFFLGVDCSTLGISGVFLDMAERFGRGIRGGATGRAGRRRRSRRVDGDVQMEM